MRFLKQLGHFAIEAATHFYNFIKGAGWILGIAAIVDTILRLSGKSLPIFFVSISAASAGMFFVAQLALQEWQRKHATKQLSDGIDTKSAKLTKKLNLLENNQEADTIKSSWFFKDAEPAVTRPRTLAEKITLSCKIFLSFLAGFGLCFGVIIFFVPLVHIALGTSSVYLLASAGGIFTCYFELKLDRNHQSQISALQYERDKLETRINICNKLLEPPKPSEMESGAHHYICERLNDIKAKTTEYLENHDGDFDGQETKALRSRAKLYKNIDTALAINKILGSNIEIEAKSLSGAIALLRFVDEQVSGAREHSPLSRSKLANVLEPIIAPAIAVAKSKSSIAYNDSTKRYSKISSAHTNQPR